jgi:hypothetical protein
MIIAIERLFRKLPALKPAAVSELGPAAFRKPGCAWGKETYDV